MTIHINKIQFTSWARDNNWLHISTFTPPDIQSPVGEMQGWVTASGRLVEIYCNENEVLKIEVEKEQFSLRA